MKTRPIAIFGVLATTILLAGCGSDDGDSATDADAGALTKAEFVERGNEICTEGNEEILAGIESFGEEHGLSGNDQPTEAQAKELVEDVLLPAISKQVGEIRDLGVPEGEGKAVNRFLASAEAELARAEADPGVLTREEGQFDEVNREARALGLTACGEEI